MVFNCNEQIVKKSYKFDIIVTILKFDVCRPQFDFQLIPQTLTTGKSMTNPAFPDSEVLKNILEPLLEDFVYWFGRSLALLEKEEINFMTEPQKNDLIARVTDALQGVKTAKMMYKLSGEQVGVEVQAMMPWHNLLMECQAVGMKFRQSQAN